MTEIPFDQEQLRTYRESDSHLVVTAEEHEHGLSAECECGQGLGMRKEKMMLNCPSCDKTVIIGSLNDATEDEEQSFLDWS